MVSNNNYPPKITRPTNRNILLRERLFSQLDEACKHSSLVWASAPGGSGKTTLISSYLQSRKQNALWYQIDEGDINPATFFHYLGLAGKKAAPRRRRKLPSLTAEYMQNLAVFTHRFFEEMISRLGDGGIIVLDNFQLIDEGTEIAQLLISMAEAIAGQLTIIILSRNTPPPHLSGLQAKGELFELDVAQIHFSEAEWLAVSESTDTSLKKSQLLSLHQKMDGWVSGLMLCQSSDFDALLNNDIDKLVNEPLFNYFAHEFFHHLDKQAQTLLIHCAYLDHFSVEMAQRISDISDAAPILKNLLSKNHFIQRQGAAVYTLHSLFQYYLQSEAKRILGSTELKELILASADLLAAQGRFESAIQHYIDLAAWPTLASLIKEHAHTLYQQGRTVTLQLWLAVLPDTEKGKNTWLLYWEASLLSFNNIPDCLDKLDSVFDRFITDEDGAGACQCWLLAMQLMNNTWMETARLPDWLARHEKHHHIFNYEQDSALEASRVANLAHGYFMMGHDPTSTEFWLEQLGEMIAQCTDPRLQATLLSYALFICMILGYTLKGKQYLKMLNDIGTQITLDPLAQLNVLANRMLGEATLGDPLQCLRLYSESQTLQQEYGVNIFCGVFQTSSIMAALAVKETEQAKQYLKCLKNIANPAMTDRLNSYWGETQLRLIEDRPDAAIVAASKGLALMQDNTQIPAYALILQLSLIEAYHANNELEKAQSLLEAAIKESDRLRMPLAQIRTHLLIASIANEQNDRPKVHKHLLEMFKLAKLFGLHLFCGWVPGHLISWACHYALNEGIETEFVHNYVTRLIPWLASPNETVNAWPWPIRIYTLGTFKVVLGSGKILGKSKKEHRPLEILQMLVIHSGEINTSELMQTLYPKLSDEKQSSTLRKHLHQLRIMLGHELAIIRDGCFLKLNQRLCWLDADAFEVLLKDQSNASLKQALTLYQGIYLPNVDKESFEITMRREQLRGSYLRAVLDHLQGLEGEQAIRQCLDALHIEPLSEVLYQTLMSLYRDSGRMDLARATYEQCRRILRTELGVEPMIESQRLAGF